MDHALRRALSQDIRRLVTGRMTNDEFDEVYDRCMQSQDLAVQQIAEFGYCLYSSDVLIPYRLKGCHAVDRATRRTAARCVLFLRSGLPYNWPRLSDPWIAGLLYGLALLGGIPTGLILLAIGMPYLLSGGREAEFWRQVVIVGTLLFLGSLAFVVGSSQLNAKVRRRGMALGDFDVWPFFRREEFYTARLNGISQ
jgi:hypothetical protein